MYRVLHDRTSKNAFFLHLSNCDGLEAMASAMDFERENMNDQHYLAYPMRMVMKDNYQSFVRMVLEIINVWLVDDVVIHHKFCKLRIHRRMLSHFEPITTTTYSMVASYCKFVRTLVVPSGVGSFYDFPNDHDLCRIVNHLGKLFVDSSKSPLATFITVGDCLQSLKWETDLQHALIEHSLRPFFDSVWRAYIKWRTTCTEFKVSSLLEIEANAAKVFGFQSETCILVSMAREFHRISLEPRIVEQQKELETVDGNNSNNIGTQGKDPNRVTPQKRPRDDAVDSSDDSTAGGDY